METFSGTSMDWWTVEFILAGTPWRFHTSRHESVLPPLCATKTTERLITDVKPGKSGNICLRIPYGQIISSVELYVWFIGGLWRFLHSFNAQKLPWVHICFYEETFGRQQEIEHNSNDHWKVINRYGTIPKSRPIDKWIWNSCALWVGRKQRASDPGLGNRRPIRRLSKIYDLRPRTWTKNNST